MVGAVEVDPVQQGRGPYNNTRVQRSDLTTELANYFINHESSLDNYYCVFIS